MVLVKIVRGLLSESLDVSILRNYLYFLNLDALDVSDVEPEQRYLCVPMFGEV